MTPASCAGYIACRTAVGDGIVRCLPFAIVLAGCTFDGPGGLAGDPEVEPDPVDIPPAPQPVPRHCGVSEAGVLLCIDFEDPSLAQLAIDGSPHHNNAVAANVASIERLPGEKAASLSSTSTLLVPESAMLDVPKLTLEMWIRPAAEPGKGKSVGLFDNPGQYAMRFENKRRVRCGLTDDDDSAHSAASVPMNMWSHVACRFDGNNLRIYINGQLSECATFDGTIKPGGLPGAAIGSRLIAGPLPLHRDPFIGAVDNVRIYNSALPDDQICTAAGYPSGTCNKTCPTGGDGSFGGPGGGPGGPGGGWVTGPGH